MQKAQGALEYLLLIGGGLLVATITIGLLVGTTGSAENETLTAGANALCAKYSNNECASKAIDLKGKTFQCYTPSANTCRAMLGIPITSCVGSSGWVAGQSYYLANDITKTGGGTACLSIFADNVIFTCANKKITYNDFVGIGVDVYAKGVTVSNCNIEVIHPIGFQRGIGLLSTSSNTKVINNTINARFNGIEIEAGSENNILQNNTACSTTTNTTKINVMHAGSPQNFDSGQNTCDSCIDEWANATSNPSPVCPCEFTCS